MELKDQIRICREAAGLSRADLAKKLTPPVHEQSIIWWETGEHRPRMTRIGDINRVLGVMLDVSEQGEAKRDDGNGGQSSAVDAETLSLAIHISRLPLPLRRAIETIAGMGSALATGKQIKPFVVTEPSPSVGRKRTTGSRKQDSTP